MLDLRDRQLAKALGDNTCLAKQNRALRRRCWLWFLVAVLGWLVAVTSLYFHAQKTASLRVPHPIKRLASHVRDAAGSPSEHGPAVLDL